MYKRKIITTMPANVRWSPICLTCGRESLTDEDVTCPTCGSARASWEEITQKSFDPKPLEGYNHYEAVCPTCGTRKTVHLLGDLKLLRNLDTVRCGVRGHAPTILNPYLK